MNSLAEFKSLKKIQIQSILELRSFWEQTISENFKGKTLCLLVGPLGSGKTESLKQIYDLYGFEQAASPSFAIHHHAQNKQRQDLEHVDLYRLQNQDDLESTGFWDLFQSDSAWIFVEWGNLIDVNLWPLDWPTFCVEFAMGTNGTRQIELSRLAR